MTRHTRALLALAAACGAPLCAAAQGLEAALGGTEYHVEWRIRYEHVDQAGFARTADALTSRLRGGLTTGEWARTSLLIEGVWVEDLVDDYDSTTNGRPDYPVVADPAGFAALNRFALVSRPLDGVVLTFGRQRIALDDHRFAGNVGWRQTEQTFDALRAQWSLGRVAADLSYATRVNRIFGPESAAGEWQGDIVLARFSRAFSWGTVTGFGTSLELDDAPAMSTRTVGLKVAGAAPIAGLTATYAASLARQSDAGRHPLDYSARYALVEGGIAHGKVSAALGVERLGGDGTASFTTPLATLHAFQGWADAFLQTPPAGLEDRYVRIGYALGQHGRWSGITFLGRYHDFTSDVGGTRYGSELDLQLVAGLGRAAFTLKHARYRAKEWLTDTNKLWVSIDYAF